MGLFGRRDDNGEGSRSADERETARLTRERRRLERQTPQARAGEDYEPVVGEDAGDGGRGEPAGSRAAGPSSEPLHRQPGPVTEPFAPVDGAPSVQDRRRRVDQPTAAFSLDELEAEHEPEHDDDDVLAPGPARRGGPGMGHPGRRTVSLPRRHAEPADDGQHYEAPIGTRRAGRAYLAQPGAAPPGHRQLTVRRRGPRKALIAFVVFALLVLAVVAAGAWYVFQPLHGDGEGSVRVTIPTGATARQIGDRLAAAGVVENGMVFGLRARLSGQREKLRAGAYTLKRNMSYAAALTALTTPPKAAPVTNVTLPEGPSRRELAPIVRRSGVRGSYLAASVRSPLLNPRAYGAPRTTKSLEGFLFPSTYQLRRSQATAKRLVAAQLTAFKRNIAKVSFAKARRKNLTRYDVLIIASMIEREARIPRERRLVAAVIYNRLQQGIPLGIDATIRFADRNWTRPLRESELARDTPYNTRLNQGLPPGPIGNPGLASIQAAANPANVNYLFYVVKPCGKGAHNFSSTDAQFQRDVAAYNRKRDELGGRDPSTCKR